MNTAGWVRDEKGILRCERCDERYADCECEPFAPEEGDGYHEYGDECWCEECRGERGEL